MSYRNKCYLLSSVACLPSVRPSLTFHVFNFCSETTKWNLNKLDMKQELNIIYQVFWVFSADRKTKMSSYWLRHFNCCREFELVSCAQCVSLLSSCLVSIVYKQVENAKMPHPTSISKNKWIFLPALDLPASFVSSVKHIECVTWTCTHVRNLSRWLTAGT